MNQPYPDFDTVTYRAEGGFTTFGSGLLLFGSLLGGLVLGVLAGFVSRWFYLVLIFPCVIGAGVGAVGYVAVRAGKVRNAVLGGISGLLGGFFAMLSMHYLNYMEFENGMSLMRPEDRVAARKLAELPIEQIQQLPILNPEMKQVFMDPAKRAGFLVDDFFSFMNYRATEGVTFNSARGGGNNNGMNLGYIGSWIYWAVEILIVAGIALSIQMVAAAEPFCSACESWKESRELGPVPDTDVHALRVGELSHFNSPPSTDAAGLAMVSVSICPQCGAESPVDVKLANLIPTKDGINRKEIAHVTYPGEALPFLERIFQPPPVGEPVQSGEESAGEERAEA